MLILTRRIGEEICIGKDIRVKVLATKGHQVKLGIEAPEYVDVHRLEIFLRIAEEEMRCQEHQNKESDAA